MAQAMLQGAPDNNPPQPSGTQTKQGAAPQRSQTMTRIAENTTTRQQFSQSLPKDISADAVKGTIIETLAKDPAMLNDPKIQDQLRAFCKNVGLSDLAKKNPLTAQDLQTIVPKLLDNNGKVDATKLFAFLDAFDKDGYKDSIAKDGFASQFHNGLLSTHTKKSEGQPNAYQKNTKAVREFEQSIQQTETAIAKFQTPALQEHVKILAKAKHIQNLIQQGKLDPKQIDTAKLSETIANSQKIVSQASIHLEKSAQDVIKKLDDPAFQNTLKNMPEEQRTELLGKMLSVLSKTEAGTRYFEKNLLPAMKGEPTAPSFWKDLYSGGIKNGQKTALKLLEGTGAMWATLAAKSAGLKTIDFEKVFNGGMMQALGLKGKQQLDVIEKATALHNSGKISEAKELLKQSQLGHLCGILTKIAGTFTVLSGVVAFADAIQNPKLKTFVSAGKSTAELIGLSSKLFQEGTHYARYTKLIGKYAPPVDILLGGLGLVDACKTKDVGGIAGNSLTTLGGIIASIGLAKSATVIGASTGVPMIILGGILSGVGGLVAWTFGDSNTTKWLKEHAPEYLSSTPKQPTQTQSPNENARYEPRPMGGPSSRGRSM